MSIDQLKSALKKIVEDSGLSLGALMGPLRVIIVGSLTGPDLFLLINTLGTREVIKRIQFALEVIK
jgi:glutamyl-tRNA synthetase